MQLQYHLHLNQHQCICLTFQISDMLSNASLLLSLSLFLSLSYFFQALNLPIGRYFHKQIKNMLSQRLLQNMVKDRWMVLRNKYCNHDGQWRSLARYSRPLMMVVVVGYFGGGLWYSGLDMQLI